MFVCIFLHFLLFPIFHFFIFHVFLFFFSFFAQTRDWTCLILHLIHDRQSQIIGRLQVYKSAGIKGNTDAGHEGDGETTRCR